MLHLPANSHRAIRLAVRTGLVTPVRFVILTNGRAGSVLLLSLLGSVPGIDCHKEVLGWRPQSTRPWARMHAHAARASLRGATAWGSSLLPQQLLSQRVGARKEWLGRLHDSGFRVITLVRSNPVRAGLSVSLASARGVWHHRADTAPPPVRLDPIAVLRSALYSEQKAAEIRALIGERSHLALSYESALQDAASQQETVGRILRFLELPPASATTPLVRLSSPLRAQIENLDEIIDLLAATHLRAHLDGIIDEKADAR